MRTKQQLLAVLAVFSCYAFAESQEELYRDLEPKLSGHLLSEVPSQPFAASGVVKRPFFDYFNWQNFIALMWPSNANSHGEPWQPESHEAFGDYSGGKLPVWLGWKSAFDLFPQNGSKPVAWSASNGTAICKNGDYKGQPVLVSGSKFSTVADELDQAFSGPLVDQTGLFTRYEVRVNKVEYDFIRERGYYNRSNWPAGEDIILPSGNGKDKEGVIEVKAAWRDLSKVAEEYHSRFFTLDNAIVSIPGTCDDSPNAMMRCDCSTTKVGLVGFHIAQKTPDFPQWVWGTFEQVDNLGEDPSTPKSMTPSYYDPELYKREPTVLRANPAQHPGSSRVPAPGDFSDSTPINVVRLSQIPDTPVRDNAKNLGYSTIDMNTRYRNLLKGTVWEHYQLIGSQWPQLPSASPKTPTDGDFGCEDGTSVQAGGMPFPECQLANVTMETYHQYDSCMNCHQGAQRAGADFSWILATRAYSDTKSKGNDNDK
ncbi:hypothetical protein [Vibrio maritimus]|uniref:hypothetical protein n=1 Tax=Vibrio maritimus TaxID=990268 RepID=UPI00373694F5